MIPEKANRVLNVILFGFILIVIRLWYLSVIQYDTKVEEARRPQRRIIAEPAVRATLRDRFGIPLAVNKIQYNAAILYTQIAQIPSVEWLTNQDGKKVKRFKRKEHIKALSAVLARELDLNDSRLEDLIHSKAALYYNIPYVIKEALTEKEYYRLKMLEKDWLGIFVQKVPKRNYPLGKIGGDIVGYMGSISREQYEEILHEIKDLEIYLAAVDTGEDLSPPIGYESPMHARKRLIELQDLAYTATDYVGKSGIEAKLEKELRGYQGRKKFQSDARGNFLRPLPGQREPIPGKGFMLSISAELQKYAEGLLIQNEGVREAHLSKPHSQQTTLSPKQPWIKGGAIVAMDPNTGEILALASYPRFDPNDFILSGNSEIQTKKRKNVLRWFETEEYLGQIWDQLRPLEKEQRVDFEIKDENVTLTWPKYLEFILPKDNLARQAIEQVDIGQAIKLQLTMDLLLGLMGEHKNAFWLLRLLYPNDTHIHYGKKIPFRIQKQLEQIFADNSDKVKSIKAELDPLFKKIPDDYDKVLFIDLCRLAVNPEQFTDRVVESFGGQNLAQYRESCAAIAKLELELKNLIKKIYNENEFKAWRLAQEQTFIKQKRQEEKKLNRYPRPYTDYLDHEENRQFQEFWQKNRWQFIFSLLSGQFAFEENFQVYKSYLVALHKEIGHDNHQTKEWVPAFHTLKQSLSGQVPQVAMQYLQTLRTFKDLNRPLLGSYPYLKKTENQQLEKHLAQGFYPKYGFGYGRSYAYRQATPQGSIFKLVTAYTGLAQKYEQLEGKQPIKKSDLNPLEMVDIPHKRDEENCVGTWINGVSIPQYYKGGRLPKSAVAGIGKLDIVRALEVSSNPYFALLAGDIIETPQKLIDAAEGFCFGKRTGVELPGEIKGNVPQDVYEDKSALYSFAIGQHSLVVTPLQTTVMLASLANGGKVLKPNILHQVISSQDQNKFEKIPLLSQYAYQEYLNSAGIDFPLFTKVTLNDQLQNTTSIIPTTVKKQIFYPPVIQEILFEAMHKVVQRIYEGGLGGLTRLYKNHPEAITDFIELKDHLIGKTSTAEVTEQLDLDLLSGKGLFTHGWFAGIAVDPKKPNTFLFRDAYGRPELVVVVYLRYSKYGREAIPMVAQMVKKWREIKSSHGLNIEQK